MKQNLVAVLAGLLFGFGLGLSQMVDRERVLGFLDVTGVWDPTLLFVLGGAVGVTVIAFRFVLRWPQPLLGQKFFLPTKTAIDRPLLVGAAIFGVGWGISGYCPGPGLTALVLGIWNPVLFVLAMLAGSLAFQWYSIRSERREKPLDGKAVRSVQNTSLSVANIRAAPSPIHPSNCWRALRCYFVNYSMPNRAPTPI
jgi:hypothetical protein